MLPGHLLTKHILSNICSYLWCNPIINKDWRNWRCQYRTRNADSVTKMKLWKGWGVIRNRKQETILHTRRYKIHTEPEKYYHSKLLLYYPWNHEDDIISTYTTYHNSYMSKQDIIHQNTKKFNEDCVAFHMGLQDFENNIPQSAWEMVAPHIAWMIEQQMSKVSTHCRMSNKKKKIP